MEEKSLRNTSVSFPQKSLFTIGLTYSDDSLSLLRTKSCYNLHRISQPVYSLFPVIMNVWEYSRQIGKKKTVAQVKNRWFLFFKQYCLYWSLFVILKRCSGNSTPVQYLSEFAKPYTQDNVKRIVSTYKARQYGLNLR